MSPRLKELCFFRLILIRRSDLNSLLRPSASAFAQKRFGETGGVENLTLN